MSKPISTDLSSGFSNLDSYPLDQCHRHNHIMNYQTANRWYQLRLDASTGCNHTGDLKVERLLFTLPNSTNQLHLYYMEFSIQVIFFLLWEDLKHIAKQYKWASSNEQVRGSSERGEVAACGIGGSQLVPLTKLPKSLHAASPHHKDQVL